MKRNFCKLISIFLAITTHSIMQAINTRQEVFSHSYMFPRPAYDHRPMFLSQWSSIIHHECANRGFQLIPFFQKSIPMKKTARYFLPNQKNELLVSGDNNLDERCSRDIRAEWVNLPSNFSGILKIKPEQQQFGFSAVFHQHLSQWFETGIFKNWYISLHIPFVSVENKLGLTQERVKNPNETGNGPRDILAAFTQKEWCFGKLYTDTKSRESIGEITLILGSNLHDDNFHFYYETIIGFATGTKSDPAYLFSPFVGNDTHWEFGAALGTEFAINNCTQKYEINFFIDLATRFLFQNKQLRTFDLKGKDWSRFLPMNKKCPGANNQNIPGVNLLTLEVRSKPFNISDFSTGFRLYTGNFHAEIGYNLWAHTKERLRLDEEIREEFGIAGTESQKTASSSTIEQRVQTDTDPVVVNDAEFVAITKCDINIDSARSARAQNHKIYASAGVTHIGNTCNCMFGFGAFYDVPQKNNPFKLWGIWTKVGATF